MKKPSSTETRPAQYMLDRAKEMADEFQKDEDFGELPSPLQNSAVRAFHAAVDKKAAEHKKRRQRQGG